MRNALLLLTALSAASCLNAQTKLAGGPFVVNAGQHSATVVWILETGRASLGTAPDKLETTGVALRAVRVPFTGLTPGTTYYYNVTGGDIREARSAVSPESASPEVAFSFHAVGGAKFGLASVEGSRTARTRQQVVRSVNGALDKAIRVLLNSMYALMMT